MRAGETATCDGEQVVILQIDPGDGWVQVQYPDGDKVWTPPDQLTQPEDHDESLDR